MRGDAHRGVQLGFGLPRLEQLGVLEDRLLEQALHARLVAEGERVLWWRHHVCWCLAAAVREGHQADAVPREQDPQRQRVEGLLDAALLHAVQHAHLHVEGAADDDGPQLHGGDVLQLAAGRDPAAHGVARVGAQHTQVGVGREHLHGALQHVLADVTHVVLERQHHELRVGHHHQAVKDVRYRHGGRRRPLLRVVAGADMRKQHPVVGAVEVVHQLPWLLRHHIMLEQDLHVVQLLLGRSLLEGLQVGVRRGDGYLIPVTMRLVTALQLRGWPLGRQLPQEIGLAVA
mmetsp:Transcript_2167/g.5505  ORF Transcript_2167/g.5505 Transcript_2167/m.5505 type:complete len:288 (+) Transcript_2167:1479-2342(+)